MKDVSIALTQSAHVPDPEEAQAMLNAQMGLKKAYDVAAGTYDLALWLQPDNPLAQFSLACTKGTYVRSIAHELGQKVGCGAHLVQLSRVKSGKFEVSQAIPLDRIMSSSLSELERHVIPFLALAGERQ